MFPEIVQRFHQVQLDINLDEVVEEKQIEVTVKLTPAHLVVKLTTPFQQLEQADMTLDYDMNDDKTEVNAEIHINDDSYELGGHYSPEDVKFTLTLPNENKPLDFYLKYDFLEEVR